MWQISFSKRIALLQVEKSIPLTVEAEKLGISNLHFWKTNSIFFLLNALWAHIKHQQHVTKPSGELKGQKMF